MEQSVRHLLSLVPKILLGSEQLYFRIKNLESKVIGLNIVELVNGIAVGIFGMVLSAAFCDIIWTKRKYWFMAGSIAVLLILQGISIACTGGDFVYKLYPVITHIPMVFIIYLLCKKLLWSLIAVLTAYLCCQLRRWFALVIWTVDGGEFLTQDLVEFVITIPLLFALIYFVAPAVRMISHRPASMQMQFGLISMLSYCFDYMTRIYTNMLSEGKPVIVEFMFFMCSVAYLMSMLHTSREERNRIEIERTRNYLSMQIAQAMQEIEGMRKSEQMGRVYRHDLRHHMQYILACVENDRLEQVKTYIHKVCDELEAQKVRVFCKNEAVNLILSAFKGKAEEQNITMDIKAEVPKNVTVSEGDLCILLSNSLENALHACKKRKEKGLSAVIEVLMFEKNGKLLVQIINSCEEEIVFKKGVPVSNEPGHGVGVYSICTITEKYYGVYNFSVEDDKFILQVSL